jgi:hypothetical protein
MTFVKRKSITVKDSEEINAIYWLILEKRLDDWTGKRFSQLHVMSFNQYLMIWKWTFQNLKNDMNRRIKTSGTAATKQSGGI